MCHRQRQATIQPGGSWEGLRGIFHGGGWVDIHWVVFVFVFVSVHVWGDLDLFIVSFRVRLHWPGMRCKQNKFLYRKAEQVRK